MVVGAAGAQPVVALRERLGQRLRVRDDLPAIALELGLQRLAEGHGLGRDDVHERPALAAREHLAIELRRQVGVVGHDEAAARTAQGLVGGRGDHVRMREGRRMDAGGAQARDVRDIGHEVRPHRVGNCAEAREVDRARVRRVAADDDLGLVFLGQALDLVVIEQLGPLVEVVFDDRIERAAEVGLQAVRQVAT